MTADDDNPYGLTPMRPLSPEQFDDDKSALHCRGRTLGERTFHRWDGNGVCAKCGTTGEEFQRAGGHFIPGDP